MNFRINDKNSTWRIVYRIYADAILILEVFSKKTNQTPKAVIDVCKARIKHYENIDSISMRGCFTMTVPITRRNGS